MTRHARMFGALGAGAVLALVTVGCDPNPSAPSGTTTTQTKTDQKTTAVSAADARCQQLLASGLEMMRPENLGISAQERQVVDSLNNWAGDCGKSLPTLNADPAAKKEGGSEAFADLYDLTDIEHIRNCWLAKQLGSGAQHAQTTDLDRSVALFELTCRTVALLGKAERVIPETPYDIMVLGRGTPEDRAWLFGELLRQSGIDSVIVRPKASGSDGSGETPRWLVGVLLDKQVYLFDPTLSWPIPSPDDKATTPTVTKPATLAQVVADDKLLRKLDLSPEKKYPLKASDLKSVQVEIITSGRYSEARIRRIESFLAGNRSATVYAPLADAGGRPGLRSRVESGGPGVWKKEDVSVWEYPDRQLAAAHHLDPQTKEIHDSEAYWLAFDGPVDLEFDLKTMRWKVSTGTSFKNLKGGKASRSPGGFPNPGEENDRVEVRHDQRKQLKSRIAQLQGDYPQAIRKYLSVQLDELPPKLPLPEEVQERARNLPPDKRPKGLDDKGVLTMEVPHREFFMNFRAAEDAKFWMGVCQLAQHEPELATETLESYIRRYVQQGVGRWIVQAGYLRGMALAESKKYALAVQNTRQLALALPEKDYRRPTFELFSERWRAARDVGKPSPSGATPNREQASTADPKAESAKNRKPEPAKTDAAAASKPAAPQSVAPKSPAPTTASPPAKSEAKSKSP